MVHVTPGAEHMEMEVVGNGKFNNVGGSMDGSLEVVRANRAVHGKRAQFRALSIKHARC